MRNADEHKKLLAQIAELEKNSVNYFDVEKEFFLIDSNNLSQVRPKLYGYSIQATGIYEDDNLTPEAIANLDGRGCYVYVEVRDGKITIKQDLNGCWGIYLFRHGDYFALSNSFFRLLDHIKYRYPLTVNRDYCHWLMINKVSAMAYSETAINEIQLVDQSAILHIDKAKKNLEIDLIDCHKQTIFPDSQEGIAILDNWVEFWGNVFCGIAYNTKFFSADLSGGFDTRISLAILLNSGIDLNKMVINSYADGLHTHGEDYDIATKIAEHYGFKLNLALPARESLMHSIDDIFNLNLYELQTFNNLPRLWGRKAFYKTYSVTGSGNEIVRGYCLNYSSLKYFIDTQKKPANPYSHKLSHELSDSIKNIIESAFSAFQNKYKIEDPDSLWLAEHLYQEARYRHHFGKGSTYVYLAGKIISFSPGFDPQILTLRFNGTESLDHQLLMALLFVRYAPDLLKFPVEGNRSIAPETIAYAQKINERFPRQVTTDKSSGGGRTFHLQPRNLQAEKIFALGKNNPNIPSGLPENCLKAMFESSKTYGLFTTYFDEELYHYASNYYDTHVFGRDRPMYAICGVTRVLEDVEISQRNYQPYQDTKRFIEQDFCRIPYDDAQTINKVKGYVAGRVDIQLRLQDKGDFKIISLSDDKATVEKPGWFNNGGIGYVIHSYTGKLEIVAKATADGKIQLSLKGMDIRNPEGKRVPYWIDYTKLTVNGEVIFDKLTPAWHDKSYNYTLNAKANEEIKIQVEWLPHRSDT